MKQYENKPPMNLDSGKEYEAIIKTNKGDMKFKLFATEAPITVNNFVFLAEDGFYNDTTFHRVIEDFMAQGGDPTGTGTGGPGYKFEDEFDSDKGFNKRGILAMANAGPDTNGSQFFITFEPTEWLTGKHTIFGELIDGEKALSNIAIREPGSLIPADIIVEITIVKK